jgi:hypothetical protein
LARFLGISLKHPLIYNSNKSSIIFTTAKETQTLPLYISTRSSDYKTLDLALKLLGQNLKHILRALRRLREDDGMGGEELSYPEP